MRIDAFTEQHPYEGPVKLRQRQSARSDIRQEQWQPNIPQNNDYCPYKEGQGKLSIFFASPY